MQPDRVCKEYIDAKILSVNVLSDGHINETFLVDTDEGRFIVQRLQPKMSAEILEHNYYLYSEAFDKNRLLYPKWMRDRRGDFFHSDADGDKWRMYPYIDGDSLKAPLTEEDLYSCGEALARIHSVLDTIPGEPKAVYPLLHDLKYYYEEYRNILNAGNDLSRNGQRDSKLINEVRDSVLEEKLESGIKDMLNLPQAPISIVHGDPKLDNILFENGKVIGLIDLDTIMMGSRLEDIADCIRSCCVSDGKLNREAADTLITGYKNAYSNAEIREDLSRLPEVFNKITFELALRYYTDAISGIKRFREKYPGYRMERAKSLIGLTWPS